jgi:hypothetical protein
MSAVVLAASLSMRLHGMHPDYIGAKHLSCAAWRDVPIPMTTKNPVRNLPKSTTPFPWLSMKSSLFAALPHSQFGNGAIT